MPRIRLPLPHQFEESLSVWYRDCLAPPLMRHGKIELGHVQSTLAWLLKHGAVLESWRDIRASHVRAFIQTRTAAGFTGTDTARKLAALKTWVLWCEEAAGTGTAISGCIRYRRRGVACQPAPLALSRTEVDWLLGRSAVIHSGAPDWGATAKDWRPLAFRTFLLLGLEAGLRPSETLWLRWDEIDLDADVPFVKLRELPERGLKNSHASTPLELSPAVASALGLYRERCPGLYLFAVPNGQGQRKPRYARIWDRLRRESGIEHLNAHVLRRTFATFASHGLDLQGLVNVMRHNNPITVQRHYLQRSQGAPVRLSSGRAG